MKKGKAVSRNPTYILFIGFGYIVRVESIHHQGFVQNKEQVGCNEISKCMSTRYNILIYITKLM